MNTDVPLILTLIKLFGISWSSNKWTIESCLLNCGEMFSKLCISFLKFHSSFSWGNINESNLEHLALQKYIHRHTYGHIVSMYSRKFLCVYNIIYINKTTEVILKK